MTGDDDAPVLERRFSVNVDELMRDGAKPIVILLPSGHIAVTPTVGMSAQHQWEMAESVIEVLRVFQEIAVTRGALPRRLGRGDIVQ